MVWSRDYKRTINCDSPKGFSQKAHCDARKKRQRGEKTKSRSPFSEMHELKSHKSVEEIAKKHRIEVSFVKTQLKMGIPIEYEHTKDKDLATDIALQHLDEIPDYYTRLKKMEASAKKEHKKFKDIKEEGLRDWFGKSKSKDGKSGWVNVVTGGTCASDEPGEGVPKCVSSSKRASMTKAERLSASIRKKKADPGQQQKSGSAKPTYVSTDSPRKKMKEEIDLNLQETSDKPGKGSGKKDTCYHKVKSRYSVWPSAYASGALVKCRKVGADNWGTKTEEASLIRYCPKCKKNESRNECKYGKKFWDMYSSPAKLGDTIGLTDNQMKYHTNSPHPGNMPEGYDHEYSMARSELSTIIAAAKRIRKKMKGEGNIEAWVQSKITKAADYLDSAADYVDSGEMKEQVGGSVKLKPGIGLGGGVLSYPEGKAPKKHGDKEPKLPRLQQAHYEPEGEVIDEKCWPGYKKKGMKTMFGKRYPNCVKAEEFSNWRADFGLSEDWQSVNRKDKTDGLSPAAVKAYRHENPGSKLQTAVTEKKPKGKRAKRRKNFCSRMKGMRSKLTSTKTARDPDSRINKALRRWNCN